MDCGSEKTEASGSRAATRIAAEWLRLRRKERYRLEAGQHHPATLHFRKALPFADRKHARLNGCVFGGLVL